ncbi:electron transfer flavoprotein subunit alpha/FixB family protein [Azospirillum griseum]|uniref:Electron transfer flavoprotein subunit alpha/FixB family protein n=1 Tax=Azospirillum griseum TaxID=2496639 RepID=A0A431VE66_9PROT|nr:electron transfer flavoprotein subunit alpha/FixB family protein [Azospirillum griseum]RTR17602.1 electron transfer flavoprotein subunit alpha/FixB family protein [Azospirillum griseum]
MTARRRDPRAERAARVVPTGGPRLRLALTASDSAAPASGRPRRDPRARRADATVQTAPRLRLDWSGKALAAPATTSAAAVSPAVAGRGVRAVAEPVLRVIDAPACLVFAVLDRADGALSALDRQVMAAARLLADALDGAVVALAPDGPEDWGPEDWGALGADRVLPMPAAWAQEHAPEARAAAVGAAMARWSPVHVVFPESQDGGDVARRVAAVVGERLFAGVESLSAQCVARRAGGGSRELSCAPPRLLSIAADAVAPLGPLRHEARPLDPVAVACAPRLGAARRLPVDPDGVGLGEADFILSAGNGVTDWAAFADLGRALGATRAGSRVVCDAGHLPRDRQVGASGMVVSARSYLAFGIAGAPQHLQGIGGVGHVIAINTDLHAAMIKRADLAIIADAQAVMPALIRLMRERTHG